LKIGKNVVIQSGAVLNDDGFGYEKIGSKWKFRLPCVSVYQILKISG